MKMRKKKKKKRYIKFIKFDYEENNNYLDN